MSKLLRNEFIEEYGVDLLPYSTQQLSIGEVVNWKGLLNQIIDYMHYTPADYFNWSESKIKKLNKELSACKFSDAMFPDMEIKDEFNSDSDLLLPGLNFDLKALVDKSDVQSFKFVNVKAKVLEGSLRRQLAKGIEEMKNDNFSLYKDKIRRFWILEGLFYAEDLAITINKSVSVDLKAALETAGIENVSLDTDNSSSKSHTYMLKGINCPFAGELVKGRKF